MRRSDRSHIIARRLLGAAFHHVAANFGARDFDVHTLIEVMAAAIDDEITAIVQQTVADLPKNNATGD
jgi:hypothetical protein